MLYRLLTLTLTVLLFVGCASVPTEVPEKTKELKIFESPAEGKAGVYIYRKNAMGRGGLLKKDLWIDGKCLGETAGGVFFYQQVEGNQEHNIATESEFSPNHLKVFTETGKNYFIRQYIKWGVFVGGANLEEVDEAKGKAAVGKLKLAVSGNCSKSAP